MESVCSGQCVSGEREGKRGVREERERGGERGMSERRERGEERRMSERRERHRGFMVQGKVLWDVSKV